MRWVADKVFYRGQRQRSRAPRRAPRVARSQTYKYSTLLKGALDFLLLGVAGLFISPCGILQTGLQCLWQALSSAKRSAVQAGGRARVALQAAWEGVRSRGSRRRPEAVTRPQKPSPTLQPAPAAAPKTAKKGSAQKQSGKRQPTGSSSQKVTVAQRLERQPPQQQDAASESTTSGQAAGSGDEQQPTSDASPRREELGALIGASPSMGPSVPSESPTLPVAVPPQALPECDLAQPAAAAAAEPAQAQSPAADPAAAAFPGLDAELLQMLFPAGTLAEASPRAPLAPTTSGASAASSQAESVQPLPAAAAEPPPAEPPAEEPEECVVCMAAPPAATLAPCGHRALCLACVLLVLAPRKRGQAAFCPYCSQEVRALLDGKVPSVFSTCDVSSCWD